MKAMKPGGKIVCLGDITPDIIIPYGATLEAISLIKKGGSCQRLGPALRPGGSVGNAAAVLGILGMHPYMISMVGNDEYGEFLIKDMEKCGVYTGYIAKQKERMSLVLVVLDRTGERTPYLYDGPGAKYPEMTPRQMPENLLPKIGWLHTNGFANDSMVDYMEKSHQAGAIVSFDLNLRIEGHGFDAARRARIERAIRASDVVLGSGLEEFTPLTGISDLGKAARCLAAENRIVVARDGANPMLLFEHEECHIIPVRHVETVNTVGSGDIFNGGFIAAYAQGRSLTEAVVWGSLCAASAISSAVPRTVPLQSELEQRAKEILNDIV